MVHLLFELTVSTSNAVDFLLEHLTLVSLLLNVALHFVDFLLALPNLLFDVVHFLIKIIHSTLLQVYFALCLLDLVLDAFDDHVVGLAAVLMIVTSFDLNFLVSPVLQLQLQELLTLLSIELLPLLEVGDFNQ